MLLTEYVEISITNRNRNYYKNIGYTIDGSRLLVHINDLNKNSKERVDVICDVCFKEKNITYFDYLKSISNGGYYTCDSKCAKNKVQCTNIEKYGVSYALKSTDKIDELKEYFLSKFGVNNPSKNQKVKEKRRNTMYSKYGFDTNIVIPETHQKAIEMAKNPSAKLKRIETNKNKFGYDNPMKSKEIYDKFKNTNIEKYGVEFPAQNWEIFTKTQKTQLKIMVYKGIPYQGSYELDFLEKCESINILDKIKKIKSIKYKLGEKTKYYHPDFYIEDINLIIEIKSNYYYNLYLDNNICKQKSCIEQGYDFLFIIDKDYTDFLHKIKKEV